MCNFSTVTYQLFTVFCRYYLQLLLHQQNVFDCIQGTLEIFWTRYASLLLTKYYLFCPIFSQIPDFAGFWILSVFIQIPLQTYLVTSEQILKYKTSIVLQAVQCVLLILQIITSFTAIRRASRFRREQFQAEKSSYDMDHHRSRQSMGGSISIISDQVTIKFNYLLNNITALQLGFVSFIQIVSFEENVQVI